MAFDQILNITKYTRRTWEILGYIYKGAMFKNADVLLCLTM